MNKESWEEVLKNTGYRHHLQEFGVRTLAEFIGMLEYRTKELLESQRKEIVEEIIANMPKVITPTVEPPPNKLSQNQIFAGGQTNMAMRVMELLTKLKEKE